MIYGFDTSDPNAAMGALLVYGIYRSRDRNRFKTTPDMWGVIERGVKASATRVVELYDFIEKLKPKLSCSTLHPRWMATDGGDIVTMYVDPTTGELMQKTQPDGQRQFWVQELESADHEAVLHILRYQTARVIALVRDRLEREKPYEAQIEQTEREATNE